MGFAFCALATWIVALDRFPPSFCALCTALFYVLEDLASSHVASALVFCVYVAP